MAGRTSDPSPTKVYRGRSFTCAGDVRMTVHQIGTIDYTRSHRVGGDEMDGAGRPGLANDDR